MCVLLLAAPLPIAAQHASIGGAISWLQAADILGVDPRSVRRWRARYEVGGWVALYDRRPQPSPRKAPAPEVQRILRLYRERFAEWNVRHFYRFARRDLASRSPTVS